jgi:chromosome segregation ATPase
MKALPWVNLFGVLAVAGLCIFQWQNNRQLNLDLNQLEKIRLDQAAKIAQQEQDIHGLETDLAHFKEDLTKTQGELSDTRKKLHVAERDVQQLTAERDQLKASISNWIAAVEVRDKRLVEANAKINELADAANAAIKKFNDLATNYNNVVKELNEIRTRQNQQTPAVKP